jgi:putative tricarboxylic transport membrane protein
MPFQPVHRALRQDVWAGALLAAFGLVGLALLADLPLGTARRMGPGYMPLGLLALLVACGAAIALRGVLRPGPPVEPMRLRPFLGVLAGGAAFALLIEPAGILLASAGAVTGAALADRTSRWIEVAGLMIFATAFCGLVFVKLLGLNIPLWFR